MMLHQTNTGGLTAIVRDPQTIFVYWNPGSFGADKLSGKPGSNVRAIVAWRLLLQSADQQVRRQVDIDPASGRHYFNGLISGLTYEVSLCLVDTMTEVHTVSRCAALTLPSGGISPQCASGWEVSVTDLVSLLGEEGRKFSGSSGALPQGFCA